MTLSAILKKFDERFITKKLPNGYIEILGMEVDWETPKEIKTFIQEEVKSLLENLQKSELDYPDRKSQGYNIAVQQINTAIQTLLEDK